MRVMVIGASNHRQKYGNRAVRAYLRVTHDVFPVNPHEDEVEGLRCFHSVRDVPGKIDRTLFYVPPQIGLDVMDDLAGRGEVGELWLNPGADSPELIHKARALGFEPILGCAIIAIGERP
jgi:predicted CoA-binding protein